MEFERHQKAKPLLELLITQTVWISDLSQRRKVEEYHGDSILFQMLQVNLKLLYQISTSRKNTRRTNVASCIPQNFLKIIVTRKLLISCVEVKEKFVLQ